jgi:hypothetical protein
MIRSRVKPSDEGGDSAFCVKGVERDREDDLE